IYTVTAEDGTTTKDWTVTVSVYVGIEDVENSALAIYPNPNNGRFTLDFSDIYGKVNYQIYDTKGSIILSDNLVVNGNAMKEVSLNIAPGVYYVKLITETQSIIEKLVVE
ncbi:MAG: T9SS type A sorting domain-containing protein, partial [Bacteroidales bacterium]